MAALVTTVSATKARRKENEMKPTLIKANQGFNDHLKAKSIVKTSHVFVRESTGFALCLNCVYKPFFPDRC